MTCHASPPPHFSTYHTGNNDDEKVAQAEPNEALDGSGADDAKLHAANTKLPSYAARVPRQEGQPALASSDDISHDSNSIGVMGSTQQDGDGLGNIWDAANNRGVLLPPQEGLPVQQGSHDSEVLSAVYGGDCAAVEDVLGRMEYLQSVQALTQGSVGGRTPIMHAALNGNIDVFNKVLQIMEETLTLEQLRAALTTIIGPGGVSLVSMAAEGRDDAVFRKTVDLLGGEVLKVTVRRHPFGNELLADAARTGGLKLFTAIRMILETKLTEKQAMDMIEPKEEHRQSILITSVQGGNRHVVAAWAEVLAQNLPARKMTEACRNSFSACVKCLSEAQKVPVKNILAGMFVFFGYGAVASRLHLAGLAQTFPRDLKGSFLGAVSLVNNPFVLCMALSVALDKAAPKARNARHVLSSLQNDVDQLLHEILARLPKSIKTFPKGLSGCAEVFEPETGLLFTADCEGPLRLALKEGQFTETFCTAPLVFDYLSHKFVMGLPNIQDTDHVIDSLGQRGRCDSADEAERGKHYLYTRNLVAGTDLGKFLQGTLEMSKFTSGDFLRLWGWRRGFNGIILPGVRFIAIGTLAEPAAYYKVPAMRMVMDLIVRLVVLAVYTYAAISDTYGQHISFFNMAMDSSLFCSEVFLSIYVTGAIVIEIRQMGTGIHEYWKDKWNWLDAWGLGLLASGLCLRIGDVHNAYGRGIYAMSAPLMFSRVLFFAQLFPRQGLVIQMIAVMMGELAQFAVVLLVIMMGFTVGFVALLEESDQPFGEIWLSVFRLMLGDVGVFDTDDSSREGKFENFLKVMLVLYMIMMDIMLLNLLIAVLSTEHSRVDEKKDREFGVSKVRIIKHYSSTVDTESVPAPFNIIEMAIGMPFRAIDLCFKWDTYGNLNRAVGVTTFWLVTGPVTIALAWSLWIISTPYAVRKTWRGPTHSATSCSCRAIYCFGVVLLHVFTAPLVLVALWVWSGIAGVATATKAAVRTSPEVLRRRRAANFEYASGASKHDDISVAEMLRVSSDGLGVSEIWKSLQCPTANPTLSRDERRHPATVDDLKLLRATIQELCIDQKEDIRLRLGSVEAKMAGINEKLDELFKNVQQIRLSGP